MTDIELVRELKGDKIADQIQQKLDRKWPIEQALTQPFTDRELSPPDNTPYENSRRNTRVKIDDDVQTIINKVQMEYNISDDTEAMRKLLRNGLSAIAQEWEREIKLIQEAERAATITSEYLEQDTATQSYLKETDPLPTLSRRPKGESNQYRLLWYQHAQANSLSDDLGVEMSSIYWWALIMAGDELGQRDVIAEPLRNQLQKDIDNIDDQITHLSFTALQQAYGAMDLGSKSPYNDKMYQEIASECPRLWKEYKEIKQTISLAEINNNI